MNQVRAMAALIGLLPAARVRLVIWLVVVRLLCVDLTCVNALVGLAILMCVILVCTDIPVLSPVPWTVDRMLEILFIIVVLLLLVIRCILLLDGYVVWRTALLRYYDYILLAMNGSMGVNSCSRMSSVTVRVDPVDVVLWLFRLLHVWLPINLMQLLAND